LRATVGKKNRLFAIKKWVRTWLKPRLKEIAAEEGEQIFRSVTRYIIWVVITGFINTILRELQISKVGKKIKILQGLQYKPDEYATHQRIGAGTLSYKFKANQKGQSEQVEHARSVARHIVASALEVFGTLNAAQGKAFGIHFDPDLGHGKKIKITFDRTFFEANKANLGAMRKFDAEFIVALLPEFNQRANAQYERDLRQGSGSSSYGSSSDSDLGDIFGEMDAF
jgi:hypothetical protein